MDVDEKSPAVISGATKIHELFCASDSDLIIQSSDGVRFLVHRKNLESITGAFPGPEFSTDGEVVHLTEPAKVLEVVFQFVYPRRFPSLKGLSFETVIAVAEAVEKYEVFSAMNTCEMRLSEFVPFRPKEILLHAVKHDYPSLLDQAACFFISRESSFKMAKMLPPDFIMPWLEYQNAWRLVFEETVKAIGDFYWEEILETTCFELEGDYEEGEEISLCRLCRSHCLSWVSDLETIDRVTELKKEAQNLKPRLEYKRISDPPLCKFCKDNPYCKDLPSIAREFQSRIRRVPPFSQFLRRRTD